jgi:hypothetical protein
MFGQTTRAITLLSSENADTGTEKATLIVQVDSNIRSSVSMTRIRLELVDRSSPIIHCTLAPEMIVGPWIECERIVHCAIMQ